MKKDYIEILKKQFENAKKQPMSTYFENLYLEISKRIPQSAYTLEVGAGAGISSVFLPEHNVFRTDLISANADLVKENVDVLDLPFGDNEFDAIFAVDVLHHLSDPFNGLIQLDRVKKQNGKIVIVEPYVSFLSYPIYKIFHTEKTSLFLRERDLVQDRDKDPSIGNQIVAQTIFNRRSLSKKLDKIFGQGTKISLTYRDIFGFFATGGINKPLNTPSSLIRILLKLENRIPQLITRLVASRIVIEITSITKDKTD